MTTIPNRTSPTGLLLATSPPRIVNVLATIEYLHEGGDAVPVLTIEFDQDVMRGSGTFSVVTEFSMGYGPAPATGQVVFDGTFVKIELPGTVSTGEWFGVMFSDDAVLGLDGAQAISSIGWAVVRPLDYVDTEAPIARSRDGLEQLPGEAWIFFDEFLWLGTGSIVIRDQAGSVLETFDVTDSSRVQVDERRLILERTVPAELGHRYTIEVPEGALLDHLSNTAATTLHALTRPVEVHASAAGGPIEGGTLREVIYGTATNDTLIGAGEDDYLWGDAGDDTAVFRGHLSEYSIGIESWVQGDLGFTELFVNDQVANRDGRDLFYEIEILQFSDYTVHTGMLSWFPFSAHRYPEFAQLSQVCELYVGFFDRIPEAAGMLYWLDQLRAGVSLETIAGRFPEAGTQFGLFGQDLSTEAYIAKIYDQVLGRGPSHAQAPAATEIAYWQGLIGDGTFTRATVVLQMLSDVHDKFEDHPDYGWVADLLDNKVALATYYALDHGLGRHSAQEDIAFGQQLADLVTPHGYSEAIALIGLGENTI